ncbi:MAG: carboxypeptidase regulatory-like domain-containing protein [Alistipes sp.]
MKKLFLLSILIFVFGAVSAQITTSGMSGKVVDDHGEPLVGATVIAVHTPSGTQYGVASNDSGRYSLQGLRAGGPYKVTFSYVGRRGVEFTDILLPLGETVTRDAYLNPSTELDAVVVTADGRNSSMSAERAGALTSISNKDIELMPSVDRSMNDILKLTPQASSTTSGLAIGGGNYRQSYVTVDGAAFNNAFGIGGNLPSGGTPISLDALEQVAVAVTPYDVRQSGFTGGAINAVTKSGTNDLKISVYDYYKSDALQGNRYGKEQEDGSPRKLKLGDMLSNTLGVSLGTPIVKDKLFLFANFEYDWNTNPGNSNYARDNVDEKWGGGTQYNRPTVQQMEEIKSYLGEKYGYDPGRYQNYSVKTPGWKLMARVDWNINKYSSPPPNSISPLSGVYDYDNHGRTSDDALYFESARYYQELNFTSVAAELNSRFAEGRVNNILRATYSHQYEPRSYEGGLFPTVDILQTDTNDKGEKTTGVLTTFGLDPFTYGSLRDVSTYIVTDEVGYSTGIHNIMAGMQFEYNHTKNGYMPGGAGYYVYDSWDDFKKNASPTAFAITHANRNDLKQTYPSFNYMQYSIYAQDELRISPRLKATIGVRLEVPIYPSLDNNENGEFTKLFAANGGYKTSDMPKARVSVSPRFGFNWDMTGERKYIMRGGTGIFTGRLPFVWIISAVGNSNCIQAQNILYSSKKDKMPGFHPGLGDILNDLYGGAFEEQALPAPQSPTIMDRNLKMPSTWKTSLAFDLKLPGDIDFNIEGIYNQDINSVAVSKLGQAEVAGGVQLPGEPRPRKMWKSQGIKNADGRSVNPYLIHNSDLEGWYYSVTAQASKKFKFGLSLMAAYTYSESKNVIDGIGDQVTSAYNTNTFCTDGSNTPELGYSSYVSPHRIVASVGYRKEYGKHFGTSVVLFYEAFQHGYIGKFSYSRYSYTCFSTSGKYTNALTGDGGAPNLLYVPTREQLDAMPFTDDANKEAYWQFIQDDSYLRSHIGEYTQRGGAVMPWQHVFNVKFAQDFFVNVHGKRNTITVGVDINNVANLLCASWGNVKSLSSSSILDYTKEKYTFKAPKWDRYANPISTWSAMISVRYTFN